MAKLYGFNAGLVITIDGDEYCMLGNSSDEWGGTSGGNISTGTHYFQIEGDYVHTPNYRGMYLLNDSSYNPILNTVEIPTGDDASQLYTLSVPANADMWLTDRGSEPGDYCLTAYLDKSSLVHCDVSSGMDDHTTQYRCHYFYDGSVVIVLDADIGYKFDSGDIPTLGGVSGVLSNGDHTCTFTLTGAQFESGVSQNYYLDDSENITLVANLIADVVTYNDYDFVTDPDNCSWSPNPMQWESGSLAQTLVLTANTNYHWDTAPVIKDSNNVSQLNAVLSGGGTIATFTFDEFDLNGWCSESGGIYHINIDGDAVPDVVPADQDPFFSVWIVDNTALEELNDKIYINPSGDSPDALATIISLKKFYVIIPQDGTDNLRTGKWTYNITCGWVGDPWKVTENIGSISIPELDESALGYAPYVNVELFLPFCGFVTLDANKVIGKELKLHYGVDVIGGKCLAKVYVVEDNVDVLLATASGIIADDLPVSTNMQHLKGMYNTGVEALGDMTPYALITYQNVIGGDGHNVDGYNTDELVTVGSCDGYVKFKKVVVDGSASGREKKMIEQLLMEGVIV